MAQDQNCVFSIYCYLLFVNTIMRVFNLWARCEKRRERCRNAEDLAGTCCVFREINPWSVMRIWAQESAKI